MKPPVLDVGDLGLRATTESVISADQAERLAATLGAPAPRNGDALPLLWHWVWFTPTTPTSDLGPDGHPRMSRAAATEPYPRRMWIGGRVRCEVPMRIGDAATRQSRVTGWRETTGASGEMLIVTLEHVYQQFGRTAVVEEQDLAYRSQGPPVALPAGEHLEEAPPGGWRQVVTANPSLLFRFSALTFNSHRIHYDEPYARQSEGYPTTVVQGPLTAILLAGLASRGSGRDLSGFDFRASAPLFAGLPFTLVAGPTGPSITARAIRNDGLTAMTATAVTA